jgi:hypothetical protein
MCKDSGMAVRTAIALAILVPLLGWRLYARLRRMVGRQRLTRWRPWLTLGFFPLLAAALALVALAHLAALAGLAAGLLAGSLLALFALRRTIFEATPAGFFYTPSAHVGGLLAVLLAARVLYRLVELSSMGPATLAATPPGQLLSPLTLAVVGAVAGYYVAYAAGLLRWRRAVERDGA